MKTEKMNQIKAVLKYMQENDGITSMEAFKMFGCTRLADKILKLRQRGYDIKTDECVGKTRYGSNCTYAKYRLIGGPY